MKAEEIIKQLYLILPEYTDLFSDQISTSNISVSGNVVTVTTSSPHGLTTGRQITISGAKTATKITSLTRNGSIATAVTNQDHDLTEGFFENIEITGADQAEYNGTHKLLSVPNRFTFTFSVDDSAVTPATGTDILLLTGGIVDFNGRYNVTVNSPTEFEFELAGTPAFPPEGEVKFHTNIRISGAVNVERAIESYTRQSPNDLWAFVVLDDSAISKDRQVFSDAITTRGSGIDYRMRLLKNFSIYIVIPATQSISGRQQRDLIEDIEPFLYRSILGVRLSGPFTENTWAMVVPNANGFYDYVGSYYVHRFQFQTSYDLLFDDTALPNKGRAFRDIAIDYLDKENEVLIQSNTNLDDEPI